jgi:hypothetical protein
MVVTLWQLQKNSLGAPCGVSQRCCAARSHWRLFLSGSLKHPVPAPRAHPGRGRAPRVPALAAEVAPPIQIPTRMESLLMKKAGPIRKKNGGRRKRRTVRKTTVLDAVHPDQALPAQGRMPAPRVRGVDHPGVAPRTAAPAAARLVARPEAVPDPPARAAARLRDPKSMGAAKAAPANVQRLIL